MFITLNRTVILGVSVGVVIAALIYWQKPLQKVVQKSPLGEEEGQAPQHPGCKRSGETLTAVSEVHPRETPTSCYKCKETTVFGPTSANVGCCRPAMEFLFLTKHVIACLK